MKFRIKLRPIFQHPLHPASFVICLLALVLVVDVLGYYVIQLPFFRPMPKGNSSFFQDHVYTWCPYAIVGGLRVAQGIDVFNRGEETVGSGYLRDPLPHRALIAMMVSYIIAPAMLLWALKWKRRNNITNNPVTSSIIVTLAATMALYILAWAFLPTIVGNYFTAWKGWQQMKTITHRSEVSQYAETSVRAMAYQAQVLRAESKYQGREWPQKPASFVLKDLEAVLPPLSSRIWSDAINSDIKFYLAIHSSDSLTIWAVADEVPEEVDSEWAGEGERQAKRTFLNKDGRKGRIQVRANVTSKSVDAYVEN
jgi:hypothetical protein